MGTALENLRVFFKKKNIDLDKKSVTSLLVLLGILIVLPIGIFLIKQNLTFLPKASGELIQLGDGGCVKLNENKQKVVDCPLVPLRLINPFYDINTITQTSTPQGSGVISSVSPSPSGSGNATKVVRVTGTTDAEIQAALDSVKASGGAVYIPAGTYQINNKVRVFSNVTLFGDGIDKTILDGTSAIGIGEAAMGNDSNAGQQNIVIRDMTIRGYARGGEVLKIRNLDKGFIYNVKVERAETGILLGFVNGKGVTNVRVSNCQVLQTTVHGIFMSLGENNVIDHCVVDSGGSDSLGIGLEIGVEGKISNNRVLNNSVSNGGHSYSFTAGNDSQYQPTWINSDNIVCANSAQGNHIQPIWDQRGKNNVYVGNNVNVNNVSSFGFEEKGGTDPRCDIPAALNTIPALPTKPTAQGFSLFDLLVKDVSARTKLAQSDEDDDNPGNSSTRTGGDNDPNNRQNTNNNASSGSGGSRSGTTTTTLTQTSTTATTNTASDSTVNGTNSLITASPNPCTLADNGLCSSTITWNVPGKPNVTITIREAPGSLFASGPSGSQAAPWISASGATFDLYSGTTLVDSVVVKGTGTPSASGSPVASNSGVLKYRLAESQAGLEKAQWKEVAFKINKSDLALIDSGDIFNKIMPPVFAQDTGDDNFTGTSGDDSDDNFTSSGSANPLPTSRGTPSFSLGPQFIDATFLLADTSPGVKQVWVQFLHPDGTTRVDSVTFSLVDQSPQILGLACNLDISKENLKITIDGENFSNSVGTVETTSPTGLKPEVLGWNDKQITAILKKPNIPINEGQRFKMRLKRPDGFVSGVATCAVDKSLVSLGARLFCREPGKFDATNVVIDLLYNSGDSTTSNKISKVEEKVTINADGEIANLKTKLQVDKNYAISVKAPYSLRRAAVFTAQEGTTEIVNPDGTPFILPIGDIAPKVSPDGAINSLDRSELVRQWRILGQGDSKLTADFNRDNRVNSIDWACMNYDFGKEDDPIPTSVPQPASGTIHIPGQDTMTIPATSPSSSGSPAPSPTKDTSNSAKIDLGGKLFLDTNRNKTADIGESFIAQGAGTVKLLQVPEDHVVGQPLTSEELANSVTLAQTTNNLPGANYDISVFVAKDSSPKFSIVSTANSGQLSGTLDFSLSSPITNSNQVINIPVSSVTI